MKSTWMCSWSKVDFMGDVDYFLGTAFNCLQHKDGNISVLLCQSAFTEFTTHRLLVQSSNKVPNITLYRSGFPICSILPVDPSIIGTIQSKGFSSIQSSNPPHMIPASFMLYLKNQNHRRPSQKTNPNFTLASMLTIWYSNHHIKPRRSSSRI